MCALVVLCHHATSPLPADREHTLISVNGELNNFTFTRQGRRRNGLGNRSADRWVVLRGSMTNHVHMSLPDVTSFTHTNELLPTFLQRWLLIAWWAGCALAAYNYLKLQLIPIRQYISLLSPPLHSCTIQERISFSATSITLISQKS